MKPNPMKDYDDADLDLLLQAHLALPVEELAPSSGFLLSVMDGIRQQATEPPPLAFPWRRVVPGLSAALCALVAFVLFATTSQARISLAPSTFTGGELVLGSVLLAACISVVAVAASFRVVGRH